MGGSGAHEYMAPCAAGENEVALAPGYAANVEVASRGAAAGRAAARPWTSRARSRPRASPPCEAVSGALGVPAGALDEGDSRGGRGTRHGPGAGPRRPPPQRDQAAQRPRRRLPAGRRRRRSRPSSGRPGSSGPWAPKVPVLKDAAIQGEGYVRRRQPPDAHLIGVAPGRDFDFEEADIRSVEAGDLAPGGQPIEIEPAIEIGNIFKLGTRYSEPLGANYLDEDGKERPIVMGSYGIGPARIVAAAIEQGADERGIVWPPLDRPVGRPPGRARQGRRRGGRGRGAPLRGARGERGRGDLRRPRRRRRARSSPTPSCSAARCGSRSAAARSPRASVEAQVRAHRRRGAHPGGRRRGGDRLARRETADRRALEP